MEDLLFAIEGLKYTGLGLHLAYVLSYLIPGSELGFDFEKYLTLRDPNTGDTIAYISVLKDTAVVDPRYDVTEEDIDNLLREILNAVYTLIAVCLSYVSRMLSERSDQKWLERGKLVRDILLRISERLVRHNPVIIPEISRMVEEFLNKVGVWGTVRVVYRVKAPRELKDYIVRPGVYVSADLETDDERIRVGVDSGSRKSRFRRKTYLALHFKTGSIPWWHEPALKTTVDATLRKITCRKTSCYAEIEALVKLDPYPPPSRTFIPLDPGMVKKHVSMVTKWWEIAPRAIEPKLVFLEQELVSLALNSETSEYDLEHAVDKTKLLKFWLTLTKHGEWNVVSVEPE